MPSVLHVGFSRAGGAGEVMYRLNEALVTNGWESRVHSMIDTNLRDRPLLLPRHTMAAALDHWLVRTPSFLSTISFFRDRLGDGIANFPLDPDLIHLHWINGVTSISQVSELFPGKKIVWTLHDMNAITASCHQSLGCKGFLSDCASCPAVRPFARPFVARRFDKKMTAMASSSVTLCAPSKWLASHVSQSPIAQGKRVEVVPNPLSPHFESMSRQAPTRAPGKVNVILVAQNLHDPLKQVSEVISVHQQNPDIRSKISLILAGAGGSRMSSGKNITWLGRLSEGELRQEYGNADYIVQASEGESFGLSVIEAASQGAFPIVRAGGALQEIKSSLDAGFSFGSNVELAQVFSHISSVPTPSPEARKALSSRSINLYGVDRVSQLYADLYLSLGLVK